MKSYKIISAALFGSALILSPACGGKKKKNNTSQSGLTEPDENAIVTALTSQLQLASDLTILPGGSSSAAGLREVTFQLQEGREVRLRVRNEAFEAVERAGSIMCFLSQSKFWEQANEGIYQAQIDEKLCDKDSGGDSGDPSQGGGNNQAPKLATVYVESKREDNKPLIANFRVQPGDAAEMDAWYHVRVIVVEPPSESAPAGIFDMRFTGIIKEQPIAYGFIRTKRTTGDKFILETGQEETKGDRKNLMVGVAELEILDEDTVIGVINSDSSGDDEWDGQKTSFSSKGKARFDDKYLNVDFVSTFTRGNDEGKEELKGCYDLKKYKTQMYRYDLLDTAGKPVKVNSGFSIEYDAAGKVRQGWAGYHGLWTGNETLATGSTVYKVDWGNNGQKTRTAHTVFAAPGKLTKLTKSTTTLGALKGADLNWWDAGSNYIVKWNGSKLQKTAKITNTSDGPQEEAAAGDVTIPQWGANFWVPSLNANVNISPSMELSDGLVLGYHSERTVSGTDQVPSCQLVCFGNCPVMNPTADAFQRPQQQAGPMVSDLYKKISVTWNNQSFQSNQLNNIATTLATYTWDAATQNLKEGSNAFTLPSDLPSGDPKGGGNDLQNIWSGALICADVYNTLDKNNLDPWRLQNEVTEYYRFTSGAQAWNRFTGLRNASGQFVTFDAPLELPYTHTQANDFDGNSDTAVVGKSYRLSYNGPGQLHGIPWKYNADVGRHMPLFSIKPGVKVGNYTILPLEGEQRLAKTAEANCSAIPLTTMPPLPTMEQRLINHGSGLGDANSVLKYVGGVAVE